MAYNKEKLTKLEALQELAKQAEQKYATKESVTELSDRVQGLETTGGQPNVIETVKVNGVAQEVSEKAVNIAVPTKVSELANDSLFQTNSEVAQAIQTAIAKTGHASFKKVDAVPDAETAEDNVMYLVMNSKTKHYDIAAEGVTASDRAEITIAPGSLGTAKACGLCATNETMAGKIRVRAINIPAEAISAEFWIEDGKE